MEFDSHGGQSCLLGSLLLSSKCILIPIKWMGFTKNNHLMSCIFANALHAVIIFIMVHTLDIIWCGKSADFES